MTTASIKFYPHRDKKRKKNGKVPMYLRIINNSKKAESRLPIEISEIDIQDWDATTQRFRNNKLNFNRFLNTYEKAFNDLIYSNAQSIQSISASDIVEKITGNKKLGNINTIVEYFNAHFNNVILLNINAKGTKDNYRISLNHFINYLDLIKRKSMTFSEIEKSFSYKFNEYLMSEIPVVGKIKMHATSASKKIGIINTFFDAAIRDGLMERSPFDGFKYVRKYEKKEKLTTEQVKSFHKQDWNNISIERMADYFKFSIYSGMEFGDLMNLKKVNLQLWENGDVFLQLS